MSINLKIEKQHVYLIAAILVFLIGVGVVIALGNTPNPGHSISELQTCAEGQTLKVVGGKWTCSSGGLGTPNYDSGWKTFTASTTTTLNHNLNYDPNKMLIYIMTDWSYSSYGAQGIGNTFATLEASAYGISASLTNNQVTIKQDKNPWSGIKQYRIRIWKIP